MSTLRSFSPSEAPAFEASKWLSHYVLLETAELASLLKELSPCFFYPLGKPVSCEKVQQTVEEILSTYESYILGLKNGSPELTNIAQQLIFVITRSTSCVYQIELPNHKTMIKVFQPVIQVLPHSIGYSHSEQKIRPDIKGKDAIQWGLHFTYPQLFKNPNKQQPENTLTNNYENTQLYKSLQKWLRRYTIPTPFQLGDQSVKLPIRLGKLCLPWIHQHPQIVEKQLKISI
ncbi:MAG: hypothetical protein Tsb0021_03180 [Chlamydiales bacterium]